MNACGYGSLININPSDGTEKSDLGSIKKTRQVSSMIPSARPTILSVVIDHYSHFLFCFARLSKVGTDEMCENIGNLIVGLDCGSTEWINK